MDVLPAQAIIPSPAQPTGTTPLNIDSFCCNKTGRAREKNELGKPSESGSERIFVAMISNNMSKGCRGSFSTYCFSQSEPTDSDEFGDAGCGPGCPVLF